MGLGLGSRCSSVFLLFRVGCWDGVRGLEKSDIKLISTQVVVKVEVGVELVKICFRRFKAFFDHFFVLLFSLRGEGGLIQTNNRKQVGLSKATLEFQVSKILTCPVLT